MKKILIIATDLEIGGAERALLGLLENINTEEYEVDLFLLHHRGAFLKNIPQGINLLPENETYSDLATPFFNVIAKKHWDILWGRLFGKIMAYIHKKAHKIAEPNSLAIHYSFKYTKKFLPIVSEKAYDLVLGFSIPYYIAAEKVRSKASIVWIHTDYSKIPGDTCEEYNVWDENTWIASVSKSVTAAFLTKFPSLKYKIIEIENIIPQKLVLQQAEEVIANDIETSDDILCLLSIGRFTNAKNFDNVPEICAGLLAKGLNVKWYLIGYGDDEALIRRKIAEFNMEGHVIILGKKDNPYPYIKACDVYIQPSRYEGKCVAVREAQMLGKPVIITNYATSTSQLKNGVDGVIVPQEIQGCINGIADILQNKELLEKLSKNCQMRDYSNAEEIEKLYSVAENGTVL